MTYEPISEERRAALAAITEKANAKWRLDDNARPFRFEDLNGEPEPEAWGPKYSRPSKAAPNVDRFPTNCASGQKYDFDAAKYRATMRARFTAQANADKRAWADGKVKGFAAGERDLTIAQVYARAMAEKRAREPAPLAEAA